jgi:hypothetical protein
MFTLAYNASYNIYQVIDVNGFVCAVSEIKDYCEQWIKSHLTKG